MSEKILLLNHQRKIRLEHNYLKRGVALVEKYVPKKLREVSVVLVSDRIIKKLNKNFLNKNSPTDVLSFKLGSKGEIIISVDTAKRQAFNASHRIELEILYLIIHGILHLSGFSDARSAYVKMRKHQNRIFSKVVRVLNGK